MSPESKLSFALDNPKQNMTSEISSSSCQESDTETPLHVEVGAEGGEGYIDADAELLSEDLRDVKSDEDEEEFPNLPKWDASDDDDEMPSPVLSPTNNRLRTPARPGGITPLGVRHDKGQGPLADSAASHLLSDMDVALSGLDSWRARHNQEMDQLKKQYERSMQEAEAALPVEDDCQGGPLSPTSPSGGTGEESLERQLLAELYKETPHRPPPSRQKAGRELRDDELALLRSSTTLTFAMRGGRPVSARSRKLGVDNCQSVGPSTSDASASLPTQHQVHSDKDSDRKEEGVGAEANVVKTSEDKTFLTQEGQGCEGVLQKVGGEVEKTQVESHLGGVKALEEDDFEFGDLDDAEWTADERAQILQSFHDPNIGYDQQLDNFEDKLVSWASDLESVLTKMDALQSGYQHLSVSSNPMS